MTNVAKPTPDYERCQPLVRTVKDFVAGEYAVKARDAAAGSNFGGVRAGNADRFTGGQAALNNTTYLVKFSPDMSPIMYSQYLQLAQTPGVTSLVFDAIVGAMFGDGFELIHDGIDDAVMRSLPPHVDSLSNYILEGIKQDVIDRVGVLVEYPTLPEGLSQADVEGITASTVSFGGNQILETRLSTINGKQELTRVRLLTTEAYQGEDEFDTGERQVVIVLRLRRDAAGTYYTQQKYYGDGDVDPSFVKNELLTDIVDFEPGPEIIPMMRGERIPFIPFWVTSYECSTPLLYPLAQLEVHAYNTISQANWGMLKANTPTIFMKGISPEEAENLAGFGGVWTAEDPQADAKVLSLPADIIQNYHNVIAETNKQLAAQGAYMLAIPDNQVESAEALNTKYHGLQARVATKAARTSECYEAAIRFAAYWTTGSEAANEITFKLKPSWSQLDIAVNELNAVADAYDKGIMTPRSVYEFLKQRNLVSETTTFEQWEGELPSPTINTNFDQTTIVE